MSARLKMVIGVHLILRHGKKVLLARRAHTGWRDGFYNLPCGHLDPDEDILSGLQREAREEVGIRIVKKNLLFVGCTHWRSSRQSVNLFFECRQWAGVPHNAEADKCDDVSWFDLTDLPSKIVLQSKKALHSYATQQVPFLIEHTERSVVV